MNILQQFTETSLMYNNRRNSPSQSSDSLNERQRDLIISHDNEKKTSLTLMMIPIDVSLILNQLKSDDSIHLFHQYNYGTPY